MEGFVASCTPYAAFINAGVFRKGKGKRNVNVNGMLHKSDIDPETMAKLNPRHGGRGYDFIEKGTPITVYVKEVYKQSGKITYTTDSSIEKAKIIEEKITIKMAGEERRLTLTLTLNLT